MIKMKVYNKKSNEKMDMGLENILKDIRDEKNFDSVSYIEEKSNLLNKYMLKFRLSACVVAISGGIDSAVVLGIIKNASLKKDSPIKKIVPLLLPLLKSTGVTNQKEATERGKELCNKLNLKPYIIDLTNINNQIRKDLEPVLDINGEDWAIGQLGPYSRTPIIYYTTSLLNQEGYGSIVCGTTNMDEGSYLGYIGKASDGMVDLQLISDIHKSEVYKIAKELDIPESIIEVEPSGDMYDNRNDETVFGATYDFVELYLNFLNKNEIEQSNILKSLSDVSKKQFEFYSGNLENLHKYNSHKYMSKSPAIHLDLWDSSVKNGWDNYYEIRKRFI
jgi:NAD+ synthetase